MFVDKTCFVHNNNVVDETKLECSVYVLCIIFVFFLHCTVGGRSRMPSEIPPHIQQLLDSQERQALERSTTSQRPAYRKILVGGGLPLTSKCLHALRMQSLGHAQCVTYSLESPTACRLVQYDVSACHGFGWLQ